MNYFKIILYSFIIGIGNVVAAQDCGTVPTAEQLDFMDRFVQPNSNARSIADIVPVRIPIQFHYVVNDAGSAGLSTSQTDNLLSNLNSYYINSNIEFFLVTGNPNVIVNAQAFDFDGSQEGLVAVGNDMKGVINIYFFNSIQSGGRRLCGYTRFPPSSDRVFLTYGCATGGTTLEHELGHYFTLFHTHGTTNTGTTDEFVNGSNCANAGDRLCDTPADPNLSGEVNGSCNYTGTRQDPNGDFYKPDVTNVMSYAPDGCVNKMSTNQYTRVRSGFENGRAYLNFQAEGFTANFIADTRDICVDSQVTYEGISFGAVSYLWELEGGTPSTSDEINPVVTYTQAGLFSVRLTTRNSGGEEVVVLRDKYVKVEDPSLSAIDQRIDYGINVDLSGLEVVNPDLSYTFTYNEMDAANDAGSGSIVVRNFLYDSNTPVNYDYLVMPYFNTVGVRAFDISFDVAYKGRKGGVNGDLIFLDIFDSLAIRAITVCGSEGDRVWAQSGKEFAAGLPLDNAYEPAPGDWRSIQIKTDVNHDSEFVQFFLENISLNGNNIYLDNITVMPDYGLDIPDNFRLNVSNGVVTLRWIDNNSNELEYVIERRMGSDPFEIVGRSMSNTKTYIDNTVLPGMTYEYRMYAAGYEAYKSEYSTVISTNNLLLNHSNIKNQLTIVPNPTKGLITIGGLQEPVTKIELMDLSGRKIYSKEDRLGIKQLDLSFVINSGMYLLKVYQSNIFFTQKVIIEK